MITISVCIIIPTEQANTTNIACDWYPASSSSSSENILSACVMLSGNGLSGNVSSTFASVIAAPTRAPTANIYIVIYRYMYIYI